MFNDLKTDETIKADGDKLGGSSFGPIDSGLYDFTIELAYGSVSKGGAKALNLLLKTDDNKTLKEQLWLSSGTAKGCLNYYMAKDPKTGEKTVKKYLPGFELANSLSMMIAGKEISLVTTEPKQIMLYDYAEGKEVSTEVPMVTEFLGKKITAGVLKQIVNKRVKHPKTGNYVPITETREQNEIDKFFHYPTGLTVTEAQAKETEPAFKTKWVAKWAGKTVDKTTDDAIEDPTKDGNNASFGGSTDQAGSALFGGHTQENTGDAPKEETSNIKESEHDNAGLFGA